MDTSSTYVVFQLNYSENPERDVFGKKARYAAFFDLVVVPLGSLVKH